jgi:hha toxicity modulator TomB
LIEHIATFALNYKIKYAEDNKLIAQIDEYLDDTFMLFSNYGINSADLQNGVNRVIGYSAVLSTPAGKTRPVFLVSIITIKR